MSFKPHNGGYRDAVEKKPPPPPPFLTRLFFRIMCWSHPHDEDPLHELMSGAYHEKCQHCSGWMFVGP